MLPHDPKCAAHDRCPACLQCLLEMHARKVVADIIDSGRMESGTLARCRKTLCHAGASNETVGINECAPTKVQDGRVIESASEGVHVERSRRGHQPHKDSPVESGDSKGNLYQ